MGNMSYCRFENTYEDLRDCYIALEDGLDSLSDSEKSFAKLLIRLCDSIVNEYGDEE